LFAASFGDKTRVPDGFKICKWFAKVFSGVFSVIPSLTGRGSVGGVAREAKYIYGDTAPCGHGSVGMRKGWGVLSAA